MLALAKQRFISDLTSIYSDVSEPKTHADFAGRECDAIHSFIIQAIPMTMITTMGGSVAGYQTVGPVQGQGLGGLDSQTPNIGLDIAKGILEQDLKNAYTHRDFNNPARVQAFKIASAIEKYMLSAIVQTKDSTSGPCPAPAPAGPVSAPIKGTGGILTNSPGMGYDAAKPKFKQALTQIYSRIEKEYSHAQKAKEISDVIHSFAIEGIVTTDGTFTAGASVSPDSGSGGFFPGQGQSIQATLS